MYLTTSLLNFQSSANDQIHTRRHSRKAPRRNNVSNMDFKHIDPKHQDYKHHDIKHLNFEKQLSEVSQVNSPRTTEKKHERKSLDRNNTNTMSNKTLRKKNHPSSRDVT